QAKILANLDELLAKLGHELRRLLVADVDEHVAALLHLGDERRILIDLHEYVRDLLTRFFGYPLWNGDAAIRAADKIDPFFLECRHIGEQRVTLLHRDGQQSNLILLLDTNRREGP